MTVDTSSSVLLIAIVTCYSYTCTHEMPCIANQVIIHLVSPDPLTTMKGGILNEHAYSWL